MGGTDVGHVFLAGQYLTFSVTYYRPRGGHQDSDFDFFNLTTDQVWHGYGLTGETCPGSQPALPTPTGSVVWQANGCLEYTPDNPYASYFDVIWLFNSQADTLNTLDTTPSHEPSRLSNLQLVRCVAGCTPVGAYFAWWTNDGAWNSARVS